MGNLGYAISLEFHASQRTTLASHGARPSVCIFRGGDPPYPRLSLPAGPMAKNAIVSVPPAATVSCGVIYSAFLQFQFYSSVRPPRYGCSTCGTRIFWSSVW